MDETQKTAEIGHGCVKVTFGIFMPLYFSTDDERQEMLGVVQTCIEKGQGKSDLNPWRTVVSVYGAPALTGISETLFSYRTARTIDLTRA